MEGDLRTSKYVSNVHETFSDRVISAGNVVRGDLVEELILADADIVKVCIDPDSVCTTRVKTVVSYPQLSAIIECADMAHGLSGQIIGDGGCSYAGDVAKSFGSSADLVMLGGMLEDHEESSGELVEKDSKTFMKFYGISSESTMEKHSDGITKYRAAEGKTVLLQFRISVHNTMSGILGGVHSTYTYVGAAKLKELIKRTTFIRVQEHNV